MEKSISDKKLSDLIKHLEELKEKYGDLGLYNSNGEIRDLKTFINTYYDENGVWVEVS